MSMKIIDGKIILEGDTAKNFNRLAKTPNPAVIRKRESYFREISATINVQEKSNGVRINVK